jgi:hypothetical protein
MTMTLKSRTGSFAGSLCQRTARVSSSPEAHLLEQQRDILLRHRLADAGAHHPLQDVGVGPGRRGPVVGGVVPQGGDQAVADLLLQRLGNRLQEAPGAVDVRRDLLEEVEVAGELDQHHQHGGDVGLGQGRP